MEITDAVSYCCVMFGMVILRRWVHQRLIMCQNNIALHGPLVLSDPAETSLY